MLQPEHIQTNRSAGIGWLMFAMLSLVCALVLLQTPDARAAVPNLRSAEAVVADYALDASPSRSTGDIGKQHSKRPFHARASSGDASPDLLAQEGWSPCATRQHQRIGHARQVRPALSSLPLNPRAPPSM